MKNYINIGPVKVGFRRTIRNKSIDLGYLEAKPCETGFLVGLHQHEALWLSFSSSEPYIIFVNEEKIVCPGFTEKQFIPGDVVYISIETKDIYDANNQMTCYGDEEYKSYATIYLISPETFQEVTGETLPPMEADYLSFVDENEKNTGIN